jgi:hypothetical protein
MLWLVALWGLVDPGGMQIPMSAQVILADDHTAWQPPRSLQRLWSLLRLTMLRCVWVARCRSQQSIAAFSRAGVVGAFVREVRGLILQDWARVQGDVTAMAGVPPSWLRGRNPSLTQQQFEQAWCHRGVLALVASPHGGRPDLMLRLNSRTPPGPYLPPEEAA